MHAWLLIEFTSPRLPINTITFSPRAFLQLEQATSYEDRSRVRQALRKIKRDSGKVIGRQGQRGASLYNRFRGQGSLPSNQAAPKNFVITDPPEQSKSVRVLYVCVVLLALEVEPRVALVWTPHPSGHARNGLGSRLE